MTILYQRSSQTLWRNSSGHVVLLSGGGDEQPFTVTGPGATLWSLLEVPSTADELVTSLSLTYDADVDEIRLSVEPLLDALVERRVVCALATP